MRCVRIWFNKTGMSRYISHLDLMRTMTRAIRRSKIPLWYTEGFNPHPYMTFSLPLSLGMESVCESMDIRIEGEITNEEILESLKAVMPVGIDITAVTEPELDPKFIAFGEFDIVFSDVADPGTFINDVNEMLGRDELIVQKLGKKGRRKVYKDINLIEFIKSYSIVIRDVNTAVLNVVLPAGSTTNVNPSLLADEILKYNPDCGYIIMRKQLMTAEMKSFK
ncbi:MAG: TIGR03936 family radical SAM-associated protein [Faecalibacterium sp.]|nr:TIGR03936 family radical SAM-associated protein [Ruminococcus sp.]MCM1393099.1 TIGR03936 family radical SAM-associated protein [Ruminococcus sp.]MCM1486005.1 TIGR03936 family radical SAM-associated protein [Faecalibacterium sp.]